MMEEEVIDEDYDPTDFLHNIGRGSEDQSGLSNNYNGSYQDGMEGAVVTGTVEVPSNTEGEVRINQVYLIIIMEATRMAWKEQLLQEQLKCHQILKEVTNQWLSMCYHLLKKVVLSLLLI